jgi:hypothetical protein
MFPDYDFYHPGSRGKKTPDPRTRIRIHNTAIIFKKLF